MFGLLLAAPLLALLVAPVAAQDGFYSGQSGGQYSGQWYGQVNPRVDGRPNRNEGLPPSAADPYNWIFDNPIDPGDCAEAAMLNPNARRGWQRRVARACEGLGTS